MPGNWLVEYHADAIAELLKLRDRKQRRGVETAVAFLRQQGPSISAPHMKRIAGTRKLCELRPAGGTEIGDYFPSPANLTRLAGKLGLEFVFSYAPAGRKPKHLTKSTLKAAESYEEHGCTVRIVASA